MSGPAGGLRATLPSSSTADLWTIVKTTNNERDDMMKRSIQPPLIEMCPSITSMLDITQSCDVETTGLGLGCNVERKLILDSEVTMEKETINLPTDMECTYLHQMLDTLNPQIHDEKVDDMMQDVEKRCESPSIVPTVDVLHSMLKQKFEQCDKTVSSFTKKKSVTEIAKILVKYITRSCVLS